MARQVCYADLQNVVQVSSADAACSASPTGGYVACCRPGDVCLDNNICRSTSDATGGAGNYYVAGCTDPLFKDSSCSPSCHSQFLPFITYNATSSQWACCESNAQFKFDCTDPSSETFAAPAPDQLKAVTTIALTSAGSTPASSPTRTPSATPSITPSQNSTSTTNTPAADGTSGTGISGGAIAGIVIGVAVLLAVVLGAVFFLLRRKRQTRESLLNETDYGRYPVEPKFDHYAAQQHLFASELPAEQFETVHELADQRPPVEMGTAHTPISPASKSKLDSDSP